MRGPALILAVCLLGSACNPREEGNTTVESSGLPLLVALGSASCVPCRMMQPELDKLRNMTEGYLNVVFIDVNHDRSAASRYRIRLIPTQVFYSPEGTELARHEGYFDAEGMLGVYQEKGFLRDVGGN